MAPTKSRQRQFADLQDKPVKDIDPENEALPPSDDESVDSDIEKAETKAATDHYVSVGKSKLRAGKGSTASLGPQYRGAKVSRADLEAASEEEEEEDDDDDEEDNFEDAREELASGGSSESGSGDEVFDDPETADLEADHDDRDVEIDSDDAFGESDEERFKDYTFRGSSKVLPGGKGKRIPRATAADFLGSDEDEEEGSGDDEEDGEDEEGESMGSEEDGSDDEMIDEARRGLIDDEAEESDEEDEEDDELDGFIVDSDEEEEDESGKDNSNDEDDDDEEDEDEDMEDEAERKPSKKDAAGRSDLASLVISQSKSVASSLADGQQKDVAKGAAIRQQRKAFDALLNVRIRLQKSLVAINTLPVLADTTNEDEPPYEAAEAAALKLWNAIDSFRSNLPSSGPSKKRKRSAPATAETPSQQIWESIEAAEQRAAPRRRAVLQNWSQKANNIRTVGRASTGNKFSASTGEKGLVARLDEEMETHSERLVKRTRTPRSCAPAQVARKVNEDAHIYDDADFYQLLLKELVDQRTADTSGAGSSAAATIRFAAVKEAKAKKHVDTKASKGRKMRFNVHDKLQNFMAPEDRRSWEQSAIDRLFGTLFGQKMALNEDDVSEDEDMVGGDDAEEAGLRLFRS